MAPVPNPQKTPKQKRHFPHGSGSISLAGPRNLGDTGGVHGSSFTEHRSPAVIPDTPLHEPRDQHDQQGEMEDEGDGPGASTPSSSSSHSTGFSPMVHVASSTSMPRLRSQLSFSSSAKQQLGQQRPMLSPWQHLAATGGAMTPSVERPGGEAISPFFTMGLGGGGGGGGAQGESNPAGFPGLNMGLSSSSSIPKPVGQPIPVFATNPRSHSPHLGGPFEQLNLDGGAPTGFVGASTPGIGSASMSDPFLSLPTHDPTANSASSSVIKDRLPPGHTAGTPTSGSEAGRLDALAAALAARRRGSRSGPSGLSSTSTADDPSQPHTSPSLEQRTGAFEGESTPRPHTLVTAPSGPVASGMRLKLPSGSLTGARKSPLGASSTAGNTTTPILPAASKAPNSTASATSSIPEALPPSELVSHMHDPSSDLLVLDLRQPSAYKAGHLAHAVPLPIPSTLLKRPAFTLEKLRDMLPSRAAKAIANWRDNANIVIVDQDSITANVGSVIAGVANKFRSDAGPGENVWTGKIWFLRGGMLAIKNTPGVDLEYGTDSDEEVSEQNSEEQGLGPANTQATSTSQDAAAGDQTFSTSHGNSATAGRSPKVFGHLSRAAFQQGSVRAMGRKRVNAPHSIAMPNAPGQLRLDLRGTGFDTSTSHGTRTSIRDADNDLNTPLDTGASNGTATATDSRRRNTAAGGSRSDANHPETYQPANPFFDNIRQNLELSHGGITERIHLNLPAEIESRSHELPAFLRELVEKPRHETATILAHEFENVERDEQKRLQSIMEWHSRGMKHIDEAHKAEMRHRRRERQRRTSALTGDNAEADPRRDPKIMRVQRTQSGMVHVKSVDPEDSIDSPEDYFPFSITAGVERGAKNRYKNIWPYDFSRVRLGAKSHDDGSDYINANFIHPKGTNKRYIATQGPMDATYQDFWTLVWEQHVDVIVMLTKQYEAGSIKCGAYWTDGTYGPLHLQLLSTTGSEDAPEKSVSGFDFHVSTDKPAADAPNIHRVFLLSHEGHPDVPPRKITQIQCVAWPDFDVPEDPHTLLDLVKEVDQASEEMAADADDREHKPPVLVHCSAGVGRTGSYIVVDAMLDALRREHHTHHRKIRGTSQGLSKRRQSRQFELGALSSEALQSKLHDRRGSVESSSELSVGSPLSIPEAEAAQSPFVPFPALQSFTFSPPNQGLAERMDVDQSRNNSESSQVGQMGRIAEEGSDKELREYDLVHEIETIPKITARRKDAGDPSPVLEKPQPVQAILGNMRVQRMSLCQTLRQYLFVYRAIIIGYLDMLDEEKEIEQELQTNVASPPALATRNTNNSGATTDEEIQSKRRAPDFHLSGSSLTKRPSIKSFGGKRRPSTNSGSDEGRLATSSNLGPSPSSTTSSVTSSSHRPTTVGDARAPKSSNSLDSIEEPLQDSTEEPAQDRRPSRDVGIHDMDTS